MKLSGNVEKIFKRPCFATAYLSHQNASIMWKVSYGIHLARVKYSIVNGVHTHFYETLLVDLDNPSRYDFIIRSTIVFLPLINLLYLLSPSSSVNHVCFPRDEAQRRKLLH